MLQATSTSSKFSASRGHQSSSARRKISFGLRLTNAGLSSAIFAAAGVGLGLSTAHADQYQWTPTSTGWAVTGNWLDSTTSATTPPTSTDDALFDATTAYGFQPQISTGVVVQGVIFGDTSGTAAVTTTISNATGGTLSVGNDGFVMYGGVAAGMTVSAPVFFNGSTASIISNSSNGLTFSSTVASGALPITINGTGLVKFTAAAGLNTSGGIVLNGGTTNFAIQGAPVTGGITINNGATAVFSLSSFNKPLFATSNSSTGQTITVNAGGTLSTTTSHALGNSNLGNYENTIDIYGGTWTGTSGQYVGPINLNGGTISNAGGALYLRNTYYSRSVINTTSSLGGNLISVPLNTHYGNFYFNVASGAVSGPDLSVTGVFSDSGGIVKNNFGVMNISGANTYTGGTTVNGGTLNAVGALTSGATALSVNGNASGGTFLNIGASQSVSSLSGTITNGAATINVTGNLTDTQGTATTYAGAVNGTGNLILSGNVNGSLTLSGAASFSGATTISNGATLAATLSFSTSALTMGGGKLLLGTSGTPIPGTSLSSLTLNPGAAVINAYVTGSNLAMGSITRSADATVDITLPTSGYSVTTTTPNSASSILGGWATVNGGAAWAVSSGSTGSPGSISALTSSSGTYSNVYGSNVSSTDFNANAAGTFPLTNPYVNSLQFNTAATTAVTLPYGFKIGSGGILNSPGTGSSSITGGSLTTGMSSGELFVNQWNTSGLTITSNIVNNGGTPLVLVKSGSGTATVGGFNTYTGGTYIQAGGIAVGYPTALGTGAVNVGPNAFSATSAAANTPFLDLSLMPSAISIANNIVLPTAASSTTYYTINVAGGTANNVTTLAGTISGGNTSTWLLLDNSSSGDATASVVLSGTNTFSLAGVNVFRGGLQITSDAALGADTIPLSTSTNSNSTLTFLNSMTFGHAWTPGSATYVDTQANTVVFSSTIANADALTKVGTGTLTLNASGGYTSLINVANGKLQLGLSNTYNSSSTTAVINLSGGTFATPASRTTAVNLTTLGVLSGGDTISPGNFTTATLNMSLGTITRNTGATLNFATLPTSGGVAANTANGATSILGGWATVAGNTWAVSAGTGTAAGAISALPLASYGNSYSAATSSTNFDATASGTFTPTAINSLRFNASSAVTATLNGAFVVGSGGILESSNVGANAVTISGGTSITSGSADLVINQYNPSSALTISTPIANNGSTNVALTVSGPGTVVIGGANTYNGSTYVVGGATLSASSDSNFGTPPSTSTPGSLVLNNGTILATTGFALNGSRGMAITNSGTFNIASGQVVTYGGAITNGADSGSLTKTGLGTMNLSGACSYTGVTTVSAGTLNLVSTLKGNVTVNSGGTFTANGYNELNSASTVTINTGGIFSAASGGQPIGFSQNWVLNGGSITGSAGIGFGFTSNAGITTLPSSTTAVISANMWGYATSAPLYFNVASGTTTSGIDLVVTGVPTGYVSGDIVSVTKNGTGTMQMSGGTTAYSYGGGTTYTGNTTINAGTLIIVGGGGSGGQLSGTPQIIVNSGGTLVMNGSGADLLGYTAGKEALVINGGTVTNQGMRQTEENNITMNGGTINANVAESFQMLTTQGFTATSDAAGNPATITGTGSISLAEGATGVTFTVNQGSQSPAADMVVAVPIIDHSGSNLLIKNGTGTLEFTGANTYSGGTTISAGTLQIGNGGSTGALGTGATTNNASLIFDRNATYTTSSNISGGGTLTQVVGSLTLSGSNTYTGQTTVGGGKLYVNGSVNGSSNVLVANSATLGGSGGISGPVTVSSGGIIEAGQNSAGTLTVGSLTFNGTGTINIGALANYAATPAINVLGSLAANGSANSITINVANLVGVTSGATYDLINYTGNSGNVAGSTGYPAFTLAGLPGRSSGSLSNVVNSGAGTGEIELTVTASDFLLWTGSSSTAWDTTTSNWVLNSNNGTTATYMDSPGDGVVFADTAGSASVSHFTVNINSGTVHPSFVIFNNSSNTYNVTGLFGIAGTTGITLEGTGTVNLNTPNSFTGPINISAGTLVAQNTSALGSAASISIASGATLQLAVANVSTGTSPVTLGGNGAPGSTGALSSSGNNSIGGVVTLTGATTISSDSGTLTFANTAAITGGAYNLTLAGAGNGVINAPINTGTAGITKNGAGTWTLNGASNYSGPTNVNAGTLYALAKTTSDTNYNVAAGAVLYIGYSSISGSYAGNITVNGSTGTLSNDLFFKGGTTYHPSSLILQGGPVDVNSYGTGNATIAGYDINQNTISVPASGSGSVISSTVNLQVNTYGFTTNVTAGSNTSTGDLVINGVISGSSVSGYGFYKKGTGSIELTANETYGGSGTNTYIQGGSIILNGGTLSAGTPLTLGSGSASGTLVLGGASQTLSYMQVSGGTASAIVGGSVTPSLLTLNYNVSGGTDTYSGILGGSGTNLNNLAFTKTGQGNLLLTGSANYSGATVVSAGTVIAGATNSLSAGSTYNVTTGVLDVSGFNESIGGLIVGSGGNINMGLGTILTDSGTANFNGTLNILGSVGTLPETLMTYTSAGGTTFNVANNVPTGDKLLYGATSLQLVALGPNTLVWNNGPGGGDGATWDTVQSNWVISGTSTAAVFSNTSNTSSGDNVVFDDSTSNYNVQISGSVLPTTAVFNNSAGNYVITPGTAGAGISGPGSVTINSGSGHSVTFTTTNNYSGGTTVNSGSLILASAGAFATGPLTVASGANVTINTSSGTAFTPVVTTISNSGTIDIKNNSMVIQGGNGSTGSIAAVTAQVQAAYNGGAWNGSSGSGVITSSTAANDSTHLTAVGVIAGFSGTFENTSVNSNDVLVKYTYYGDANLDGHVDGSDYSRIDNAVAMGGMTGWYNGDFNYDGVINGSDYTLIDNAYNTQGAALAGEIASPTAQIAGGISGGISAVPEPTTLGLMGLGAIGLLGRRRRR